LISAVLSPEELYAWGWRLPFFLAIPMGGVALWLRVKMEETPGFLRQQKQQQPQASANVGQTLKPL
jgi:MFS family permease